MLPKQSNTIPAKMETFSPPLLLGASLGNCVHTAGICHFFRLAEQRKIKTHFLGAAVSIENLTRGIREENPDFLCVSFRLMPEPCRYLLQELHTAVQNISYQGKLLFGGTPENVQIAEEMYLFDHCFIGDEPPLVIENMLDWIQGKALSPVHDLAHAERHPFSFALDHLPLLGASNIRMPLLRHHFGQQSLKDSICGIREIAESETLDIISLSTDQVAQESFFRPQEQNAKLSGAGGIPVRTRDDLIRLYEASRYGNKPYLRVYSGTRDLIPWAEMSVETIKNAWAAIPLCWYSELDGRSRRTVEEAMTENIEVIKWYADRSIPVEINEPHHWSLRDAPDAIPVAMAYICGYVAKKTGVRQYIAQYMFNNPAFTSSIHDVAKMLAYTVLLRTLEDDHFYVYRQVRSGLAHFSNDNEVAKGQLGMSTAMMLAFNPHIIHIVGYTEGTHAAQPKEVIESAKIVKGVLRNLAYGIIDPFSDQRVLKKTVQLLNDAQLLLRAIVFLGQREGLEDPLANPKAIVAAMKTGLLDAPHLRGQPVVQGTIKTSEFEGGCVSVDDNGRPLSERLRINFPAEVDRIIIPGLKNWKETTIRPLVPLQLPQEES